MNIIHLYKTISIPVFVQQHGECCHKCGEHDEHLWQKNTGSFPVQFFIHRVARCSPLICQGPKHDREDCPRWYLGVAETGVFSLSHVMSWKSLGHCVWHHLLNTLLWGLLSSWVMEREVVVRTKLRRTKRSATQVFHRSIGNFVSEDRSAAGSSISILIAEPFRTRRGLKGWDVDCGIKANSSFQRCFMI